jgi:hypothetical protein
VFPGDANHDGVADAADVVAVAFASGQTGSLRADTSTRWYGQQCIDWGDTLPNGRNIKHADSDANGIVSAADTNAIARNYGFTHTKTTHTTSTLPIQLLPRQTTFTVGDVIELEVHVGDNLNIATDILGISYTIHSPGLQTLPGQVWTTFPYSFLGNSGSDFLAMGVEDRPIGQHHVAHGRIAGVPATGMGHVATLHIRTDSINCPAALNTFQFSLSDPTIYLAGLVPEGITPTPATITVYNPNPVGGAEALAPSLSISPVPADAILQVTFSGTRGNTGIRVTDLAGRVLLEQLHRQPAGQVSIPTASLAEGTYLLLLQDSKGGSMVRRFTVMHH